MKVSKLLDLLINSSNEAQLTIIQFKINITLYQELVKENADKLINSTIDKYNGIKITIIQGNNIEVIYKN